MLHFCNVPVSTGRHYCARSNAYAYCISNAFSHSKSYPVPYAQPGASTCF